MSSKPLSRGGIFFLLLAAISANTESAFADIAGVVDAASPEVPSVVETPVPIATPEDPKVLALTGSLGVPLPLLFGVEYFENPKFQWFGEAGYFRYPILGGGSGIQAWGFQGGLRYHPFANWFMVTGTLGFRNLAYNVNTDISAFKIQGQALIGSGSVYIASAFIGVGLGGKFRLSSRSHFEFEVGYQLPFLYSGDLVLIGPDGSTAATNSDLISNGGPSATRIAGLALPQLALFRFVWEFR